MALVESLVQVAGKTKSHEQELLKLLKFKWPNEFLLSSAFVRATPFVDGKKQTALHKAISAVAGKTTFFVGIRNEVTSIQGILELLKTGARVFVVDMGTTSPLFHPKIYCGWNDSKGHAIVGSANLTHNGLFNNVEASSLVQLDLSAKNDTDFLSHITQTLHDLTTSFPDHAFQIASARDAVKLFREGYLEDERVRLPSRTTSGNRSGKKTKSKIGLKFKAPGKRNGRRLGKKPKKPSGPDGVVVSYGQLLWRKPTLPKGDLQLPSPGRTNPTGVLRLTQAKFQVGNHTIDQTTYFRNLAFGGLAWTTDPSGKEVASADFQLFVAGVFYGVFKLNLSHKVAWESGQGNYTTGLHWGTATGIIKQKGLIGRTLYLYGPAFANAPYTIDIP